jgi:hypothetical protein
MMKTISTSVILSLILTCAPEGFAATVTVRHPEGTTHGYLALVAENGQRVAQGELFQTVTGARVDSRLVFYFKDGSLHDERVVFSQHRLFTLLSYRLTQNGPSFPEAVEILMDRPSGRYAVRSRMGQEPEEMLSGQLDLPPDVYNGMLLMLLKNLPRRVEATVRLVVFTPTPRVVPIKLVPVREETVKVGAASKQATQYELRPQLGRGMRFFGRLFGLLPVKDHYYCWILHDGPPAFVQFEGPLFLKGPIWRIELLNPQLASEVKGGLSAGLSPFLNVFGR